MSKILEKLMSTIMAKETLKAHHDVEQQPFILRYIQSGERSQPSLLTLHDHYNLLSQLLPLYEAFEEKLKAFVPAVPISLRCICNRSDSIKHDLAMMRVKLGDLPTMKPCLSTKEFESLIKACDLTQAHGQLVFLAYFLVEILGDLNGGQIIAHNIKKMYQREGCNTELTLSGLEFYTFPEKSKVILHEIDVWLDSFLTDEIEANKIRLSENHKDMFGRGALTAFQKHTAIVKELEESRVKATMPLSARANSSSFFSSRNLTVAVEVSAVLAAVSTALYLGYGH